MISEKIISSRNGETAADKSTGVALKTFVSAECGATAFSTGTARFQPGEFLPYHTHQCSEAITSLEGTARILVEGRGYTLQPRDCLHVPANTAHRVENGDASKELLAHWSFATASPSRQLVDRTYPFEDRGSSNPFANDPETLVRCAGDAIYELAENAFFCDLFARRFGSVGICGGYGRFLPGASLPCHTHDFDESITIVQGSAICLVEGRQYQLSGCDTAFIPKGLPHRFLNQSDREMAMVWVYAGSEPDRRMVDAGYCSGALAWPGPDA